MIVPMTVTVTRTKTIQRSHSAFQDNVTIYEVSERVQMTMGTFRILVGRGECLLFHLT